MFFVDIIGVREFDAAIIYNELLTIDTTSATVDQIKDLLWSLNSQLQVGHLNSTPDALLQRCILPVQHADGQVRLCPSAKDFAIVDRKTFFGVFRGKIDIFDFTLTEVRQLEPFIEWSGLGVRYLSRLIKEITILDEGLRVPVSDPIQDVKRKSYEIYR